MKASGKKEAAMLVSIERVDVGRFDEVKIWCAWWVTVEVAHSVRVQTRRR